ncbi:MAG TPA: integrin alpha, partial [Ignavibacteriaceae bacterium]|nr:integrin alpha [Ignavibacteriaceae bacterium]
MKKNHTLVMVVVCLLSLSVVSLFAQRVENKNQLGDEKTENIQPIDINSKAQELGISEEHLQSILNSAANNGGGDPLPDAIQQRHFTGQAAGDWFGYSVSTAGDVNGDGYSDVIVGASLNDAGGSNAGRAYIYFGGANMDNTADVILTGAAADDYFGYSVSTAGDVNGDGYSDVIVGASLNDAGGSNAGRAYIYYGGANMDNTADVILTGAAADDYFGSSVSTAGDVNGDGYSDVIVGAYGNDAGGTSAGRAYIYYGGANMDNTADVILTGAAAGDWFGSSVSTAGDVNGDGYSDVIVGAPFNDAGGTSAGRAYIYFGGANMDSTADVILTGAAAGDYFGYSVSTAGDVNGDGYSDVIVGAYGNDAGGSNAGRAYIYFGGANMDSTADVILTGAAAGDWFGYSVSTAGDVNGDGYS